MFRWGPVRGWGGSWGEASKWLKFIWGNCPAPSPVLGTACETLAVPGAATGGLAISPLVHVRRQAFSRVTGLMAQTEERSLGPDGMLTWAGGMWRPRAGVGPLPQEWWAPLAPEPWLLWCHY